MKSSLRAESIRGGAYNFPELPIDQEVMFSNHQGVKKPRIERRQRKLLAKISFIKPFLAQGEHLMLVTTCCSPLTLIEQLTGGWTMFFVKRALLIFTDRRIFHVPTKMNYTYRNSVAQILYGDCDKIVLKRHQLVVAYKSGKKESFPLVDRRERKKIKSILSGHRLETLQSEARERTHLCPSCRHPLRKDKYVCPQCHLQFKDYNEARKVSILYPGGGYFYTGHPWLGISDAVVEFFLLLVALAALWEWFMGVEEAGLEFAIFGIVLIIEKIITIYHSLHFVNEFIPKERNIHVQPLV